MRVKVNCDECKRDLWGGDECYCVDCYIELYNENKELKKKIEELEEAT